MLGNTGARAPATPSMVKRPWTGSSWPTLVTGDTITRGRSKLWPPSKDRAWKNTPWRVWMSVPTHTTNTVPWLSVRIPQPWRPPVWALLVAGLSWRCRQLWPPSVDRANNTGSPPPPCPSPRKPTLHTYTLPKWGLDSAWSAQSCSLSLNNAELWRLTITGSIQASLSPATAPARSSDRDTVMAPWPLKPWRPGKLVAMLA